MKRTPADIYATAQAAGLSSAQAVIATAIALGESGGDDANVGDVSLQTDYWGPSVGLWQVRTVKSETGTGSDRDIMALQGNPSRQARAMFNISNRGTNWTPWTVYTRGIYSRFMGQAQSAMTGGTAITGTSPVGAVLTPVNAVTDTVSAGVESARKILVKLSFAGLGLALVGAGLILAMRPQLQNAAKLAKAATDEQVEKAKGAAKIAATVAV
jgi:hypothetical protein